MINGSGSLGEIPDGDSTIWGVDQRTPANTPGNCCFFFCQNILLLNFVIFYLFLVDIFPSDGHVEYVKERQIKNSLAICPQPPCCSLYSLPMRLAWLER